MISSIITPTKAKARNSDIGNSTLALWFSATSILISIASLLYNILKITSVTMKEELTNEKLREAEDKEIDIQELPLNI